MEWSRSNKSNYLKKKFKPCLNGEICQCPTMHSQTELLFNSEPDAWQREEQAQHQEGNRSYYNHKGRNNNNNTRDKTASLWDVHNPAMCDSMRACRWDMSWLQLECNCWIQNTPVDMPAHRIKRRGPVFLLHRCHQEYVYAPACTNSATSSFAALPGHDYEQPLLPQNPGSVAMSGPPQYGGLHPFSCQTTSPDLVQTSAVGPDVWQYGEQQRHLSGVNPSTTDESSRRNVNPAKEFSIRIISVWGHITQGGDYHQNLFAD